MFTRAVKQLRFEPEGPFTAMKLAYKNERDIADFASHIDDTDVCFYPAKSERAHRFLSSLRSGDLSHRESPDFEDVSASILLEAMIVDVRDQARRTRRERVKVRCSESSKRSDWMSPPM